MLVLFFGDLPILWRRMLTDLRLGAVEALQWRDPRLDGQQQSIQPRASTAKAERADELPLHHDLAIELTAAMPPTAQPGDRVSRSVSALLTFKRDLQRADIPFEDDRGHTVDRHGLRTTFVSWLGLYEVDPRGPDCAGPP